MLVREVQRQAFWTVSSKTEKTDRCGRRLSHKGATMQFPACTSIQQQNGSFLPVLKAARLTYFTFARATSPKRLASKVSQREKGLVCSNGVIGVGGYIPASMAPLEQARHIDNKFVCHRKQLGCQQHKGPNEKRLGEMFFYKDRYTL